MKKLCLLAVLFFILAIARPKLTRYSVQFWGSFDTVTSFVAYCESDEEFNALANRAIDSFSTLHSFYDRFSQYDRIVNLATLNQNPDVILTLPDELYALLEFGKNAPRLTDDAVNPLFGPVTELWREKISAAGLYGEQTPPADDALLIAKQMYLNSKYTLLPNHEAMLSAGGLVDVGAFAKGYAVEETARRLAELTPYPFAIISGGNIRAYQSPPGERGWAVSVSDPDEALLTDSAPIARAHIKDGSAATSGDYQRYFVYEGQKMHHIISPFTLYPANRYRSVTVIAKSAAEADLFSTALYIHDIETGKRLAAEHKLSVCWVHLDKHLTIYNGANEQMKFLQ